ncbi:3'-5' exonuclease [Campylobacter sp. FMV-PI01]|uniref:3'-5' exonuclease n=2 Tax=Campylobacter portucalensis TaxID=2608384 RepID=A0A6L5WGX8_9BACT|nr:3'-5' exonuclease [Campylobacter portucalensis]
MKEAICIFDCETIPCVESLKRIYPNEYENFIKDGFRDDDFKNNPDYKLSVFAQERQFEATNSNFLPVNFHKIVCISVVLADEFGSFLRVSNILGDEKEIINKFFSVINNNIRLISFNGRGFDLPMIMARAMRYNLSIRAYFEVDNKNLNKSKWDGNYRSRYDGKFHLDLMDHISDFGIIRGLKLDTLCASLNLPGKFDTKGDQVMELFYQNKLEKISSYCQSDVLNTYWLFLKYELLKGNLNLQDYASYLLNTKEYLEKEKSDLNYTPVFSKFIDEELERIKLEIS